MVLGSPAVTDTFLGRYHCVERLGDAPLGDVWRAKVYGLGGFEKEFAITQLSVALSDDAARRWARRA